jgi:hypothetical protein
VVLNKKLDEIKTDYDKILNKMNIVNNTLQKQIILFEKLGEDGNIGIKFSEMNS